MSNSNQARQTNTNGNREYHPLSNAHYQQVIRRPRSARNRMASIYGITWNLRGRTMLKLGTASMQVLSYHPSADPEMRDTIELRCITAAAGPGGTINYNQVRMSHDFLRSPFPGARERVLDPRDEGCAGTRPGDRPNASWVKLALEVDRKAAQAAAGNHHLPVVPMLPVFYAGFSSMSDISMEITPALLWQLSQEHNTSVADLKAMPAEELNQLATAFWPRLWRAPDTEGNDTGKWLIETAFITDFSQSTQLYEDFSDMMGVDVWNPVRNITQATVANPVAAIAAELNISLSDVLISVARYNLADKEVDEQAVSSMLAEISSRVTAAGSVPAMSRPVASYEDACEQFMELVTAAQAKLAEYGTAVTEEVLEEAVNNFDKPIVLAISDPWQQMPRSEAVKATREALDADRPFISSGTTDEDILAALEYPGKPLRASKLCGIQLLYRDTRVSPEDAFHFTPAALQIDRVSASLWAGPEWSPRKAYGQAPQQREVGAQDENAAESADNAVSGGVVASV